MPYKITKSKCKKSSGKKGNWKLSYTDKNGKKHSACHGSKESAQDQISAIETKKESDQSILESFVVQYLFESEWENWKNYEQIFFQKLLSLCTSSGLPVSHETPESNYDSIMSDGYIQNDYGIFFSIGHIQKPQFVTSPGYIFHGYIPKKFVNTNYIVPDMRYQGEDDEDIWKNILDEHSDTLVGSDICFNEENWKWTYVIKNGL